MDPLATHRSGTLNTQAFGDELLVLTSEETGGHWSPLGPRIPLTTPDLALNTLPWKFC